MCMPPSASCEHVVCSGEVSSAARSLGSKVAEQVVCIRPKHNVSMSTLILFTHLADISL